MAMTGGVPYEIEQIEIMSDPEDIERFISSRLYTDFVAELDVRIEQITTLLDDVELKFTGRQYDMFRGAKQNMQFMKTLFPDMLANKKADLGLEEEKSE